MDKDYKDFGERMGSFDMELDIGDDVPIKHTIVTRNRQYLKDDELEHFGVKGMKWGHRKGSGFKMNANVVSKAAKTGQDAANLGQNINRIGFNKKTLGDAKKMTDDELKQLTNRLNLENNYMNAKNQQAGRGRVENILSTVGSTLALASSAAVLYETIRKVK